MYSPPNRNKGPRLIAGLWIVIVVMFIIVQRMRAPSVPRVAPPDPSLANPIEAKVRGPQGPLEDGIAVAVLVDVSGSMSEPVRDPRAGVQRPKIDVARDSVVQLIEQAGQFAREHPEKKFLLGIYEFSARDREPAARPVVPLSAPNVETARQRVSMMYPGGGTPIGDAMIRAKRDLDATRLNRIHILVVTDGENNQGYSPADVVNVIGRLPDAGKPSVYFIAFDTSAAPFAPVKNAGALLLSAADSRELQQTLDYVLTGKILAEEPSK